MPVMGLVRGALLATLAANVAAADVTLTATKGGFEARNGDWQATVAADGCLEQLQCGGLALFKSAPNFPRGAYLFQDGLVKLPQVEKTADGAVTAACEKAQAKYAFTTDGLTWTISNLTNKQMLGIIVFDAGVKAIRGEGGKWAKPPVERPWSTTTWFRETARLEIAGGTRIWGPWGDGLQVWQVDVAPRTAAVVTFRVGRATPEEAAKAREAATAPPPPPPSDPKGPMWDLAALSKPPAWRPADQPTAPVPTADGVRGVFFDGPAFEGRPTRVFAWLGLPKLPPGAKAPGMVLVHGGGGTAFDVWVKLWTARGYAAIALDTCGCVPVGKYAAWQRLPDGGPAGWGGWGQIDWPREDQWTYQAVAASILAHSLLRSLPEVDPERIGLTGISWGGYLTCILAGVDPRYKLAVPVYGCGFTNEHGFAGSVLGLGKERGERWMRWWDPSVYLRDAAAPMLWVTGTNDFAYTLNALQKSYRLPKAPHTLAVRLRMPHGHGGAGENPKEIHVFADSILQGKPPLATLSAVKREGGSVSARCTAPAKLVKAELMVTKDTGRWQDRRWDALPATLDADGRVTATLPEGAKVWYLNVFDERDCVVSSEHEEL
jgi:dienelactone hydrolase